MTFSEFKTTPYYKWHKNYFSTSFEGQNLKDVMVNLWCSHSLNENMAYFEKTGDTYDPTKIHF